MGGFDGTVGTFQWDASAYIDPTAQALYAHGAASGVAWEAITPEARGEWREYAAAVLTEFLPVVVADAVRAAAAHLKRNVEVLQATSERNET